MMSDIRESFDWLYPRMANDGVYIVEDYLGQVGKLESEIARFVHEKGVVVRELRQSLVLYLELIDRLDHQGDD